MNHAKATENRATFRMEVGIDIDIDAPAERVWALLTDASGFVGWNSTITSMEGTIAEGETIRLTTAAAGERVFKLKISEFQPESGMVWSDGFAPMFKGVRTFTLTTTASGTRFEMREVLSGLMLPMIAGSLPDFGPQFEAYARDLKAAAEG